MSRLLSPSITIRDGAEHTAIRQISYISLFGRASATNFTDRSLLIALDFYGRYNVSGIVCTAEERMTNSSFCKSYTLRSVSVTTPLQHAAHANQQPRLDLGESLALCAEMDGCLSEVDNTVPDFGALLRASGPPDEIDRVACIRKRSSCYRL